MGTWSLWGQYVNAAWWIPIGPKVVPFWGSYLEFYKVIPKRNYFGAYGYAERALCGAFAFTTLRNISVTSSSRIPRCRQRSLPMPVCGDASHLPLRRKHMPIALYDRPYTPLLVIIAASIMAPTNRRTKPGTLGL